MRFRSYFNTAVKIIEAYDGKIPLHHFLKQYFSHHKKHGSTDRKIIAHTCYNFFRTGQSLNDFSVEEKLKYAIFICNEAGDGWDFLYDEEWLQKRNYTLEDRIAFAKKKLPSFSVEKIFPFQDELSSAIDAKQFIQSFFIQPDVFIRIRPGNKNIVTGKLEQERIKYSLVGDESIAFSPSVKIDTAIHIDAEAVVQDYSSQRIRTFLEVIKAEAGYDKKTLEAWDCCAASGGKSILAFDVLQNINLTVSDLRNSIIQNLKKRFEKAGIHQYTSFVADVTKVKPSKKFDLIICDAPCTGSGTWSRTPEQLYFFTADKIENYSKLQENIVCNVFPSLNDAGYFLYITCSVFEKENEAIVEYIQNHSQLQLVQKEILEGYTKKADTMFAALFKKIIDPLL